MISEPPDRAHIPKIDGASKLMCLKVFLAQFTKSTITICIDSISEKLRAEIDNLVHAHSNIQLHTIDGGSQARAFNSVLHYALENVSVPEDNHILIQEDDYLYLPDSELKMHEAMAYGHYVTGYLHPDKFMDPRRGGNPFTYADDISEPARVIKTKSHFWMTTNSTTCTFALEKQTLRADIGVWERYTTGRNVTGDFDAFLDLRNRGRSVLMPIPTLSTHVMPQWLAPITGTNITKWEDCYEYAK